MFHPFDDDDDENDDARVFYAAPRHLVRIISGYQ
jgi:hypothetical protein